MSAPTEVAALPGDGPLAVIVARGGRLPLGADEAAAEAAGAALVVGSGARAAAEELIAASQAWWCDTGDGLRVAALAQALAGPLAVVPLVLMPASPDGRDLAPRLAAAMGRPLLAGAERIGCRVVAGNLRVDADLSRLDARLIIPVSCDCAAVATLVPGTRSVVAAERRAPPVPWAPIEFRDDIPDAQWLETIEPEPATIDLAVASRVVAGGAGIVPRGANAEQARAMFELLRDVASAIGASVGATRVATDAGWIGHERQVGTSGISIDPRLYLAFGISGASQHLGGLGAPRHVVSVNLDASAPMTAMSDLGIVCDAPALLVELARRLGITVPARIVRMLDAGNTDEQRASGHD